MCSIPTIINFFFQYLHRLTDYMTKRLIYNRYIIIFLKKMLFYENMNSTNIFIDELI